MKKVNSNDGTKIAYQTMGNGPAIILVPGALAYAHNLELLAKELGQSYTVHIMERRGRGDSGPQGDNYSINKEVEDLNAIQAKTNANFIFGHSFGGFLALEAGRNNHNYSRIALYEPGISLNGSINIKWAERCKQEIANGHYLDAFTTFVKGLNPQSAKMPHWMLKRILKVAIKKSERIEKYPLLLGTIKEHGEEVRLNNTYLNYAEIPAIVFCMYGSKSGATAKTSALKLQTVISQIRSVVLPGLDHLAPENKPKQVARELHKFFGEIR